ncbi:neurogenic locus notch homolog protein 3-like [Mytilus trossulus]|uniref:neurogenic locus notch homolog protein 3-like n=1 Tax=Mytilus trossulus TaxID=6551 RepID=UPI0030079DA3
MTTDGHVAYFTRTDNPTYTPEIITFQEKETLNDDGLFKESEHKLHDDQSDKTWQFQDSKDMQISRNRWRFGTVLFILTTLLCLVLTIYFATSSSYKSINTHGHSSLQQKTENITKNKGFTETNGHTTKEDACVSSPCLNGGTCLTAGCSYYCICPKGITGYKCAVTPCTSSPCLNNGECEVKNDTYQCDCPVGFNGPECQETPCSVEPCFYNGTCSVLGSLFSCACTEGYNGSRCEVTPCASSPCLNGGRCTPTGSSFICSCPTGYFGNQCQVQRSCQYGWKMHEDKCYFFSSSNNNWRDAKSDCQYLNSMLAEPKQMSDINFLKSNAKKFRKTFWLGGSDKVTEGVWVWTTSGQGFTVTDWHTRTVHEPNNSNGEEHCLDMHKNLDYEWNDDKCRNENRFICEKPLE